VKTGTNPYKKDTLTNPEAQLITNQQAKKPTYDNLCMYVDSTYIQVTRSICLSIHLKEPLATILTRLHFPFNLHNDGLLRLRNSSMQQCIPLLPQLIHTPKQSLPRLKFNHFPYKTATLHSATLSQSIGGLGK